MPKRLIPAAVVSAFMVLFTTYLFWKFSIPDEWDIGNIIMTALHDTIRPLIGGQAGVIFDLTFLIWSIAYLAAAVGTIIAVFAALKTIGRWGGSIFR